MIDKQLAELQNICNLIAKTTKRSDKEKLLEHYKDNENFIFLLKFLYDPYIITGIKEKKLEKEFKELSSLNNKCGFDFITLLNKIIENPTGNYKIIWDVRCFIDKHKDYSDFIKSIVTKTLKLGIQAKTINKIIPNCCNQFDLMLGFKYFDDPDKYVPEGTNFILTHKLDGMRCLIIKDNLGKINLFSRQGQKLEGFLDIEEEAKQLPDGFVYDGELLLRNDNNLDSKDLYRATMKIAASDMSDKKNIIFNCFDLIILDEFKNGYDSKPAYLRKSMLNKIFVRRNQLKWIKEVPVLYEGNDKEQINYWLNKITSEGGEGVMINVSDAPYECKRSKGLLKVKKFQTVDLRCVDIELGTGVNANRLGAITVEFPYNDNVYQVKVGSGFTQEQRDYFWQNKNDIMGKIVEVQYFEITQNQNGGYSLRFPVFCQVRNDKDEISLW